MLGTQIIMDIPILSLLVARGPCAAQAALAKDVTTKVFTVIRDIHESQNFRTIKHHGAGNKKEDGFGAEWHALETVSDHIHMVRHKIIIR